MRFDYFCSLVFVKQFLATQTPQLHCAPSIVDANGERRCFESKNTPASDLFAIAELEFFGDLAVNNGLDPNVGFLNL